VQRSNLYNLSLPPAKGGEFCQQNSEGLSIHSSVLHILQIVCKTIPHPLSRELPLHKGAFLYIGFAAVSLAQGSLFIFWLRGSFPCTREPFYILTSRQFSLRTGAFLYIDFAAVFLAHGSLFIYWLRGSFPCAREPFYSCIDFAEMSLFFYANNYLTNFTHFNNSKKILHRKIANKITKRHIPPTNGHFLQKPHL